MKYEVAMAWVKDLRENADKQGSCALMSEDGKFCCLGRLCLVVGKTFDEDRRCDEESSILPHSVRDLVGMKSRQGDLPIDAFPEKIKAMRAMHFDPKDHTHAWLCEANDNGVTFAEIADIIETWWEEL